MNISKELFSEVLSAEVEYIDSNLSYFEENSSCMLGVTTNGIKKYWNIHELAFERCMKWINDKGYYITTDVGWCGIGSFIVKINKMLTVVKYYGYAFGIEGEYLSQDIRLKPEHIFDCCQWILENKDNK